MLNEFGMNTLCGWMIRTAGENFQYGISLRSDSAITPFKPFDHLL